MKSLFRALLGIILILAGVVVILGAGVFVVHSTLGSYLAANPVYLHAKPASLALDLLDAGVLTVAQAASQVSVSASSAQPDSFSGPGANPAPPEAASQTATPQPPKDAPAGQERPASDASTGQGQPTSSAIAGQDQAATIIQGEVQASSSTPGSTETTAATAIAKDAFPKSTPRPTLLPEQVEDLLSSLPADLFPPTPEPTASEVLFAYPSYTETASPQETPAASQVAPSEAIEPAPRPSYTPSEPVVRISIPRLKVKRAVVEVGMTGNGQEWDTDSLFATRSRPDLVGHLQGSALPGEEGNTVLVGHNYDYHSAGVFVNLDELRDGDLIKLITEGGQEFVYEVVKVKSVPYSGNQELDRHARFMDPRGEERLTLVTCGGANIGFFNRRVYVVAYPVGQ